ncbi:MAG: aldo/keto reductase [Rhodospirillaceae bacterium]|nr:aldo/keto reductase [Rhodospirillaceae bacterium]
MSMEKRLLGQTGLAIAPVVFGGNVFGWTIDEKQSFAVLDAFVDHGFNAIDTADSYSTWVPGNKGGESETIIGRWLKANPAKRDKVVIFTKVGSDLKQPGQKGLSERWILEEVENSLRRLGLEYIDLYFSHWPDSTPYAETLGAYDKLIKAGKVRAIGVSNVDAAQLGAALATARDKGLPRYQVVQPEYNLYDRAKFEGALQDLCVPEKLGVVTYYSLASGFLSGKYRAQGDIGQSMRGAGVADKYLNARGFRILDALDAVAARLGARPAEVALAWLMAQKGVSAPIASATKVEQVASFAKAAELALSSEDLAVLTAAGA